MEKKKTSHSGKSELENIVDVTELEKDSKLEEIQVIEYCNRYTMLGM